MLTTTVLLTAIHNHNDGQVIACIVTPNCIYSTTTLNCMAIRKVPEPMGARQKEDLHAFLLIFKRSMQLRDNRHDNCTR